MGRLTGAQNILAVLVLMALINISLATLMGIDFGSSTYKVVLPPGGKRKQLTLALNEQSSRKTESLVGFRDGERVFASAAVNLAKFSPQNTYPYLRDILGVQTVEDAIKRVGNYIPYADKLIIPDKQYPYLAIKHDENTTFAVHELVAMMFQEAREIAEKEDGGRIVDCCITVPVFFTQDERQALIDAASIAGLNVLSLVNQGTALGINYGANRAFDEENYKYNVIFFDWGESSLELTLGQYAPAPNGKGKNVTQFQVLSSTWANVGGRDFTRALVEHVIQTQVLSQVPDVYSKPKALQKLRQALIKAKETLSVNQETDFQVQNLDGDYDLIGSVSRETFEKISEDILAVVVPALTKLLEQADLKKEDIHLIELAGGTSRIPKAQAIVKEFFGRENLDRHINADEAGVFGAAFYGAVVSGRYKLKGLKIRDITHRNVTALITGNPTEQVIKSPEDSVQTPEEDLEPTEAIDDTQALNKTIKAFIRGSRIGMKKVISFYTTDPFQVKLEYAQEQPQELPIGIPHFIDSIQFTKIPINKTTDVKDLDIKGFDSSRMDALLGQYNLTMKPKIHVRLKLGTSGLVEISATAEIHYMDRVETKVKVVEEEKPEENPSTNPEQAPEEKIEEKPKEPVKTEEKSEEENTQPETSDDESKEEESQEEQPKESATEEKPEAKPEKVKPKERWETKVEWVQKKKEVPLTQTSSRGTLPTHIKIKAKDVLEEQNKIEATRIKTLKLKNDLEAAIYEIKEKSTQQLFKDVTNEAQVEELNKAISSLSEWIEYESEGATYETIKELFKTFEAETGPIYHRMHEKTYLDQAVKDTKEMLMEIREAIQNLSQVVQVHEDNVTDLTRKINNTLSWVDAEYEKTSVLESHEPPTLTTHMLKKKIDNISGKAKNLMRNPKKRPKKPKVPTQEPATEPDTSEKTTEPPKEDPQKPEKPDL